ncbi:hypothetical protein E2C01_002497 [Portunus trituberculatus]|uniref:Uncharacterized protein n=1 Tax=Portunus trituberculatus TaxID=210409 RepID=A0A5B7CK31_PORTR|nr:hypothetical protein [Portunus trituberculatus]
MLGCLRSPVTRVYVQQRWWAFLCSADDRTDTRHAGNTAYSPFVTRSCIGLLHFTLLFVSFILLHWSSSSLLPSEQATRVYFFRLGVPAPPR